MATTQEMIAALRAPAALAARTPSSRAFVMEFTTSCGKRVPTPKMVALLTKLYDETVNPPAPPAQVQVAGAGISGVRALFDTATRNGMKRPRIKFVCGLVLVELSLAGPDSRNPGSIYAKADGEYFGKIDRAGNLTQRNAPAEAVQALTELGADPAGVAGAYGRLTGGCMFCSIPLTDDRSKAVGYGEKCAANYSLPYPAKPSARQAKVAGQQALAA